MSSFRKRALDEFSQHRAQRFYKENRPVSEFFAQNVFDQAKMRKYLSAESYEAVQASINDGKKLNRNLANQIASGMRSWAVEMGCTHYTHWFQPLTDSAAEKHESFIGKTKGGIFEHFDGKALVQQEPDASSFPNGGLRNTFEARGYTAWDPTSPAFIMNQTLCIPTIFVSYTGESLDMKVPYLKSLESLQKAAMGVVSMFDKSAKRVDAMLGVEQEYFLVDESLFLARPDLQACDRTLLGHTSAKDQQLEDHYFGAIPPRVNAFMKDFETEAYKLGILLKTRHNEVAPNQFECAPLFEESNLAIDHNLILMIMMRDIAAKHNLKVIFHEKPFNGVNGSGKHCNWSLITNNGINLLKPGKTPNKNFLFLSVLSSVLRAVYEHHYLLMASTMSLSNSYRLGGNEAPPAVMSIFAGSTLTKLLKSLENLNFDENVTATTKDKLDIIDSLPEILLDNTDRNRTSPFAFTGNRFEFRAVGSSCNIASTMFILNSAVAQQLTRFKKLVEELIAKGVDKHEAIIKVVRQYIIESKNIMFEGNGYSKEWQEEAKKRGLKSIVNPPEAFKAFVEEKSMELFSEENVLTKRETEARFEVMNESYVKKLQIEARVLGDLTINHVIPTAIKFQNTLIDNVIGLQKVFGEEKVKDMSKSQIELIEKMSYYIESIRQNAHDMIEARKVANVIEDIAEKAEAYCKTVAPYMDKIRRKADKLEMLVDDELWPLPKYRELLYLDN